MANFTKQAIKASFIKLLNEQPLNKISVRSIVEDCGINRNSFYYHFQDIPSLIGEIVKEEIDALVAKYPTINSIDECVSVALKFTLENKRAVLHIYNSVNRDIYERYLMRICEYVITTYLDTAFGREGVSERDRAAAIRFLKCELFGAVLRLDRKRHEGRCDRGDNLHNLALPRSFRRADTPLPRTQRKITLSNRQLTARCLILRQRDFFVHWQKPPMLIYCVL